MAINGKVRLGFLDFSFKGERKILKNEANFSVNCKKKVCSSFFGWHRRVIDLLIGTFPDFSNPVSALGGEGLFSTRCVACRFSVISTVFPRYSKLFSFFSSFFVSTVKAWTRSTFELFSLAKK